MPVRLSGVLMLSRRELLTLVLVFVASLPAVTARLYSSDEVEYFSYLRSLWFDRDVSFENEYLYFYDHHIAQSAGFHETFLERQTDAGRRINYATIGCAILWSPFYAAADAATRLARAAGSTVPADGFSKPYVMAVAYGSAFYGFAAIVLAIAAARRLAGAEALRAGLAVWVGTPLLFYMYVAPPFSHACSAFAVAMFVTVWLQIRPTWSVSQGPRRACSRAVGWTGVIALGLTGALMAMVREQDIFFVFGPAVDFALSGIKGQGRRDKGRVVAAALAGGAAFFVGYLPQLLAYQALNGRPRPSTFVMRKLTWYAPHAWKVLWSSEHGFFFWTPLAMLSVAGLIGLALRGRGDERRIGACALLMVAFQVYISGAVESWTVAGAFGQRRFVSLTILLVIGLAALWRDVSPHARAHVSRDPVGPTLRSDVGRIRRGALTAVTLLCVWWNIALMVEFGIGLMDRQRLELRRNTYDAFLTVPRLGPDLAYRYFMNRGSFYKPARADGR